jgi:hypothetical protein
MTAPINLYTSNNLIYQGEGTEFGAQTVPRGMICVGSVGIGGYGFTKWAVSPPADSAGNATILDTGPINLAPGTYYLVAVPTLDGFVCDTTQPSNQITFIIRPKPIIAVTIDTVSWVNPKLPYSNIYIRLTSSAAGKGYLYIDNVYTRFDIEMPSGTGQFNTVDTYPTDMDHKICIGVDPDPATSANAACRSVWAVVPVPGTFASITIPNSINVVVGYNEIIGTVCKDTNGNTMDCPPITVSLSNPGIVSLSSSGIFTGIKAGTSTLVCYVGTVPSNTGTVTVTDIPVKWKCTETNTGVCTSGTDASYTFSDQNTCQTTAPCAVVGTGGGPYYSCNSITKICTIDSTITANANGCTAAKVGQACTSCADDEILLFGNCQKKNTVYIVGGLLFMMMMMK